MNGLQMSPQHVLFDFSDVVQHDFLQDSSSRKLMYALEERHNMKSPITIDVSFIYPIITKNKNIRFKKA